MSTPFRGHFTDSLTSSSQSLLNPGSRHTSSRRGSYTQDSPYVHSTKDKFSLAVDPRDWGSELSPEFVEADDALHNPATVDRKLSGGLSARGMANLGCLSILTLSILMLFAGYPMYSYFTRKSQSTLGGYNLGGINATGQVPQMAFRSGLIDPDTPKNVYTKPSWHDSSVEMQLVFSDEFQTEGRTFYPGDDPFWEAADLHYWSTNNLEYYDPAAVTTSNGSLVITLSAKETHGLNYQGGMITSWNQFCFTGGSLEASVSLPGVNNVAGLWPALWAMGNLGRAGYGASLDGMWPYSYDSCDVGTVANQSVNGLPSTAEGLSYLPGQRLSRCTCKGQNHPGPKHSDGTYVGRSAPEIDVFEANVAGDPLTGHLSQSGQWAPFDENYIWNNNSANLVIADTTVSQFNTYVGAVYQQATSVLTDTDPTAYEKNGGGYAVYAFEYAPGFDGAYITWVTNNKVAWTMLADGVGANPKVEIGARPVPQEPMYLIANLGMSKNFGTIDIANLGFPVSMHIDYIRVYQPANAINYGCSPADFPTAKYIETYNEAYTNPNLTTWVDDYKQTIPTNSFLGQC